MLNLCWVATLRLNYEGIPFIVKFYINEIFVTFLKINVRKCILSDNLCLFSCLIYVFWYDIFGGREGKRFTSKPRFHLADYFLGLFTIQVNSAIANNLKPMGMIKMQLVIIYPNIYACVSDDVKTHHDRFRTFYGHFTNKAR